MSLNINIIGDVLGQVMKFIFLLVHHYGFSIIIFTILIKLILLPLTIKQTKSTQAMQEIQPLVKEIQKKYKNKPEKQNEEIAKLYKESKVNPLSGCLPLVIQMPILYGLFSVLKNPVTFDVFQTQAAFHAADIGIFWIKSLTHPDKIMAVLSGASAFFMQKMMTPNNQMEGSMKIMNYVMTAFSLYWGFIFPAGLALYWTISNVFTAIQYVIILGPMKKRLESAKGEVVNEKKVNEKKPRNKK